MRDEHKDYPLFSVLCMVKDRAWGIKRCIDAALAQDYPNIEIVVLDGASTDGTLEILRGYGDRIRLISEPDRGFTDAFYKVLALARGEFFCYTMSDEALLPGALMRASELLRTYPDAAAVTGDAVITDGTFNVKGTDVGGVWDFERVLCSDALPHFAASFFRTACWHAVGTIDPIDSFEYEFWVQLGVRFPVVYVPGAMALYAEHPDALSFKDGEYQHAMMNRIAVIDRIFSMPQGQRYAHLRSRAVSGLQARCAMGLANMGQAAKANELFAEALKGELSPALKTAVATRMLFKRKEAAVGRVGSYLEKGREEIARGILHNEGFDLETAQRIIDDLRSTSKE